MGFKAGRLSLQLCNDSRGRKARGEGLFKAFGRAEAGTSGCL